MISKRRSIKALGLALVAVLALGALGASAASASQTPRWKVKGAALGAGTTKAFTATSTSEIVLAFNTLKLVSPAGECTESGEIEGSATTSPGTKKNVVLTCKNVKLFSSAGTDLSKNCTVKSTGAELGTVKTNSLKSTLVWLNPAGGAAGDLLEPTSGTVFVTIEILGAACAAAQKSNLTGATINEILPVEKEELTEQLTHPSTAITSYYNNEAGRVKQTISSLKLGAAKATLSGSLAFSLSPQELVGVFPTCSQGSEGNALRWRANGCFLGAGESLPFTATNTEPMLWQMFGTVIINMPECTATGKLVGSAPWTPGGKQNVIITCKGVFIEGDPNCIVRTSGSPDGTVIMQELSSTSPGGELKSGGSNYLFTPEITGAACAWPGKSSFTGALKDVLIPEEELTTLHSTLSGSSVKYANAPVNVNGAMDFSLTSGALFGAFTG